MLLWQPLGTLCGVRGQAGSAPIVFPQWVTLRRRHGYDEVCRHCLLRTFGCEPLLCTQPGWSTAQPWDHGNELVRS